MKILGVLVIVGVCCAALAQTSAPTKGDVEEEVARVQKLWLEAEQHGDAAALDRILGDDFVGSGPGGNLLQKSDLVVAAPGSQPKGFLNQNLADTTVKAFGKTVVVFGKLVDPSDKTTKSDSAWCTRNGQTNGKWWRHSLCRSSCKSEVGYFGRCLSGCTFARRSAAQPSFVTWRPRPMASASAGTSSVIHDAAPT